MAIGWLADGSEAEVRHGLAVSGIPVRNVVVRPSDPGSDPLWWSSSAFVNDDLVAKFAWSEVRATVLHREGLLLRRLAGRASGLRLPELVVLNDDPVMVITRRLDGEPLSFEAASGLGGRRFEAVASGLARFLADLHRLDVENLTGGLPHVTPTAQADTAALRARYGRLVDDRRARLVAGWCAWVDEVLGDRVTDAVLLHGDLHGYNQLWDLEAGELVLVVDFEGSGAGDRHFDFRYLAGNSSSTELMCAIVEAYGGYTGERLSLDRIMAWHVLTALGDALWRTEAGVDLPGGGDPCSYVDEVERRLSEVDIGTG